MVELSSILPGLDALWAKTLGSSAITVAVLDGPVDQAHACFAGAALEHLTTLIQDEARPQGAMSTHGTHVASVIFGQPGSAVRGLAPRCSGLLAPVFADDRQRLSQLDLARAIEQAVQAGAQVINVSGGQLTDFGETEDLLERAVRLCQESNSLIVAAAGNDGCACLHTPAALPAVLAVGAMDAQGQPLESSNWGEAYQTQGVLAPGDGVVGAKPGGGTVKLSGTSFATPIVSGVAALLLSLQHQRGEIPDPHQVRAAILSSALACEAADGNRCLVGKLNIPGAYQQLLGEPLMSEQQVEHVEAIPEAVEPACGCENPVASDAVAAPEPPTAASAPAMPPPAAARPAATLAASSGTEPPPPNAGPAERDAAGVMASQPPPAAAPELQASTLVYAVGTLGYDFGTEARRDSFKQLMPAVKIIGTQVPANPYDARQMVDYLAQFPSEGRSLIWTLNLELTPIYAIEPAGAFGAEVYAVLQELMAGQVQAEDHEEYIERVSIPGRLTGGTVQLFSGQVVPVVEPQATRGLYGWRTNALVSSALETVKTHQPEADEGAMRRSLESFLNRLYYDFRNLGTTSQDRALNFAATNTFQAAATFGTAVAAGMELDSITVEKSPFCRVDSDCWDVKLKFFDPENTRRARKVFRFTIDVSDLIPVTLGEVRTWASPY